MNLTDFRYKQQGNLGGFYAAELFRRSIEITLALLSLVILSPILILIALAIALDSPGPVLFKQIRLGRGGKSFTMLKYRTMDCSSEWQLAQMINEDIIYQQIWATYQKFPVDPRLTRLGRFLRRFSLDELPQLINVLRGDMSLVGPRPILPEQRALYGSAFSGYIQVRPGLTGLWQVNGRNLISFADRVYWDQLYLENRSLALDAAILVRTVGVVLHGVGAY